MFDFFFLYNQTRLAATLKTRRDDAVENKRHHKLAAICFFSWTFRPTVACRTSFRNVHNAGLNRTNQNSCMVSIKINRLQLKYKTVCKIGADYHSKFTSTTCPLQTEQKCPRSLTTQRFTHKKKPLTQIEQRSSFGNKYNRRLEDGA